MCSRTMRFRVGADARAIGSGAGHTMSVRKRTWKNLRGEKEAWIVDYRDQQGARHIQYFRAQERRRRLSRDRQVERAPWRPHRVKRDVNWRKPRGIRPSGSRSTWPRGPEARAATTGCHKHSAAASVSARKLVLIAAARRGHIARAISHRILSIGPIDPSVLWPVALVCLRRRSVPPAKCPPQRISVTSGRASGLSIP